MNDLVLRWAGAGVLATGLSSSVLFGSGVAAATPDTGSDGGAAKSTQSTQSSSKPTGDKTTPPSSKPADPAADAAAVKDDATDATDTTDSTDSDTTDQAATDEDATEGGQTGEGNKVSVDAARPHKNDRSATRGRAGVDRAPASLSADADADSAEASDTRRVVTDTSEPVDHHDSATVDDTTTVTSTAAIETPKEAEPASEPDKPGVVDTIVGTVSSVVDALFSPLAANDTNPATPVAEPQMWSLAAASRREFETAFESPKLAEDVAPVENSLTQTPPPTLTDQITLLFYDGMRAISDFTGINVTAVLGQLMASEDPPFFLTFGLNTQRTTFTTDDGAQWDAWEISPTEPTDKTVIALHGGGWVLQPNLLNWIDYTTIPRETGATVIVPLYPLATTDAGKATTVIPETADFISQVIDANGDPDNVSIYADSAGSSLAMSAVRDLILADKPLPGHMVLLSMVADSSLTNPDVATINDPLFDINHLDGWDSHYFDGIAKTDPSVSPLFWDDDTLEKLPPTTLYVGEREILYPDNLLLHDRAVDLDVPMSLVVGTGLPHDWPASGLPFIFSQTAAVHPDILRQLGLTNDADATNI